MKLFEHFCKIWKQRKETALIVTRSAGMEEENKIIPNISKIY